MKRKVKRRTPAEDFVLRTLAKIGAPISLALFKGQIKSAHARALYRLIDAGDIIEENGKLRLRK